MKKIFFSLVFILTNYAFSAIGVNEIYTFNTKQKQWYQAYLYDVFPKLNAAQLVDIEIMRINNENEFEDNIRWINTIYNNIDMVLTGSQIVSSNKDEIIIDLAKIDMKDYLKTEYGNTGETIGFIADELSELYRKGKKVSLLSKLSIVSYSAQRISKVKTAVKYWYKYSDITKRQLSLLIVDKYLEKSIRKAQCINVNEDYIKSLAEELKIDTGWFWFTRDYDLEFTIREAQKYCYNLSYNSFNYTGNYPESIENYAPEKPNVSINGGTDSTSLEPTINASGYRDIENDRHIKTWWGIYKNNVLIKDFGWKASSKYLLKIPKGILENGKRYKIGVAFMDSQEKFSKAKFLTFTTKKEDIQLYNSYLEIPTLYFEKSNNVCDNKIQYKCTNDKYDILYLQMVLNVDNNLDINIVEDGKWGDETRKAVMKFQAYYGLIIDGIVGFGTRSKLDSVLAAIKDDRSVPEGIRYTPFLTLPFMDGYTHTNAPISSVFDHTQSNDGMVIAFDGTTAKKEYNINTHGSCYMMKSKNDIILNNVNYVGTDSDNRYLCYDATGVDKHKHRGIDYAVMSGTKVYASASGTVEFVGTQTKTENGVTKVVGFGKYIKINHHNGFATYYGHLSSMNVSAGDTVKRGDLIGLSGNTGGVRSHLHFGVRKCSSSVGKCNVVGRVDPFGFMGINNLWVELSTNEENEKADLTIPDLQIVRAMKDGESYNISGTIQNIGEAVAEDSEITFYISNDETITKEDLEIGTYPSVGKIESKEDVTKHITIIADKEWNKKYIGACVSTSSEEVTKDNNCKVFGYVYVAENDYVENTPYLKLYDYRIDHDKTDRSNGDGQIENGEWIEIDLKLKNIGSGKAKDVTVSVNTDAECVSYVHSSTSFINIDSGDKTAYGSTMFAFDDCSKNQKINFDVKIVADDEYEWHKNLSVTVVDNREPTDIHIDAVKINDDNHRSSLGNNDGKANIGEILELYPSIENNGDIEVGRINAYLSTDDSCIEILYGDTFWNGIKPKEYIEGGEYDKDSSRRFKVRVKPTCVIGHKVNFKIKLVSDEGTWYDDFSFKIYDASNDLGLKIVDYKITRDLCTEGYWHRQNGLANPCDEIEMSLKLKNFSNKNYSKVSAIIESEDSCIDIKHGDPNWYNVNTQTESWESRHDLDFKVLSTCPPGSIITFKVVYRARVGEYKGDDTEEYVGTDSFTIPIYRYKVQPDLEVDRIKPYKLEFNDKDKVTFETRIDNNGDTHVLDSTILKFKIVNNNSCSEEGKIVGSINVSPFENKDKQIFNFNTTIKEEWNNKYIAVYIAPVSGETNMEDNCLVVGKIKVNFIDTDGDGISDEKEQELGLDIHSADTDKDGISDFDEVGDINNPRNSDNDNLIDALDPDSDNDGVSDADERIAGTDPTDKNDKPTVSILSLASIDDVVMPKNATSQYIELKITNTTNEDATIRVHSSNTDIVVTSDSNPLELTPVPNAKGHAKISITISAGGKSDTKIFTVYVGEKPKKFVPIMMDDMTIMVPLD